ncbi:acyltransferase family protein [Budviciaceae bacterium CWB-B4]|uniref:Acyltransferase family protein n=1 Tax=Limnobaculum xujianqingii TaxID=2738837 RepID=A0A9D7AK93_9GAMM|nr:acyltransferase family protein [Limnobaculum xujianqingii]MBK5074585.1 acyltransferase family protein [Limnobaculum xujianqingii]MBK5177749.1 acyltransferase family protein [Limnobaculum xujianqingii]
MENPSVKPMQINAELIRAVAISLVVLLHISGNSFASMGEYWWVSLAYDSLTRASVPLFFMLSGALLLTKNEPAGLFYKKRLFKVVIPLLFWSYVYLLYRKFHVGESELSLSPLTILNGPSYYHLWFLYSIISIYLFIPMLRYYTINATKQVKLIILCLWLFSQSVQPFASFIGINLYTGIDAGFITRFIGFVLLGEFIVTTWREIDWRLLLGGFVASTAVTAYMTYSISIHSGVANETWFQYHSPAVIVSSLCLFMILAKLRFRVEKVTHLVSKFSFGIYFVHIIVMQQVAIQFIFTPESFNSAWSIILIPLAFLACLFIALMICILFSKTPLLRRVV